MKVILTFLRVLMGCLLLTVLTQVGGLIYLLYLPLRNKIEKKDWNKSQQRAARVGSFLLLYLLICTLIVPPLALRYSGRQALPWQSSPQQSLAPANWLTCLLNRHYVDRDVARQLNRFHPILQKQFPDTYLTYLDANFPFLDGFPLFPHLSHDDGRKLDLAFLYQDPANGKRKNGSPSITGYGICEEPLTGEQHQPDRCAAQGYWQYSLLRSWTPQWGKPHYQFDAKANRWLLSQFAKQAGIRKIFIEPHLKDRLGLKGLRKIRFHGCRAVRHDDHIHLEF